MLKKLSILAGFLAFASISRAQQAPSLDALKQEAVSETDKMQTFTQQMVDQIFSYSELGFEEVETSKYVTGILEFFYLWVFDFSFSAHRSHLINALYGVGALAPTSSASEKGGFSP